MDDELQAIRQARLAEMKEKSEKNETSPEEEQKASIMAQILSSEARERLARIKIVREDRARGIEELLLRMARSGQIQHKVTEKELVSLLEQIKGPEGPKIIYNRRGEEGVYEEAGEKDKSDGEDDFFD